MLESYIMFYGSMFLLFIKGGSHNEFGTNRTHSWSSVSKFVLVLKKLDKGFLRSSKIQG